MRPAQLLPKEETTCSLRVWVGERSPAAGIVARLSLVAEGPLTSVHFGQISSELIQTKGVSYRLAPDNPFLTVQERSKLDRAGVIRKGMPLTKGDVLLSVLDVKQQKPAEKDMQIVADASERTPEGWEGATVYDVSRRTRKQLGRGTPLSLQELIEITLRLEQPLACGDLLLSGEIPLGLVAEFLPDDQMSRTGGVVADLVVSQETGAALGLSAGMHELSLSKGVDVGAFSVFAMANGRRSLITKEPLGGGRREELGSPHPEQPAKVTPAQIGWLRERGLNQIAAELVSLKSDDFVGAHALREQKDFSPGQVPPPGTPSSLYLLRNELWSLGLVPEFRRDAHVSLTLRPATRDELLAQSAGEVKKPETINYRTYDPEVGGIMCPHIFGDKSDLNQFGHFELGCGVVPYLWRLGKPSLLQQWLALSAKEIDRLVHYQTYVRLEAGNLEWHPVDDANPPVGPGWETGAQAIASLLAAVPAERLPPGLQGRATAIVQDVLLFPPVWTRPLVLLNSGNFATSDLNDLYRRIVNRANRLRTLVRLNAPLAILLNERRMLQESCDTLFANCLLPKKIAVKGSAGELLKDLAALFIAHLNDDAKRVDWSGQARAALDETIDRATVVLPRFIYQTLRLTEDDVVLLTRAGAAPFVAAKPQVGEGHLIRLSRFACERLQDTADPAGLCNVHRPLGKGACAEALGLNEAAATRTFSIDPLFECRDEAEALTELALAAATNRTIPFDSPPAVLLAGLGEVEFTSGTVELGERNEPTATIPIPPPPVLRELTSSEFEQVIQTCRRKVCRFTPRPTAEKLPPLAGRLGGLPCLPRGMPWPAEGDEPLPFLAQLPLDLLGSFPSGSLLTVFQSESLLQEGHASGSLPVFVVSGADLVEREPPAPDLVSPQQALVPEITEELPAWETILSMLNFEFENPDPKVLSRFKTKEWPKFQAAVATDVTRVGGWAHWIQSPESEGPLVAQLNDAVDGGNLYVCQTSTGELEVFLQFD